MRLAVVGGDDQMTTGGGVFAQKFTVSVTDGNGVALVNAPVRFAVADGSDGLLRAGGGGSPEAGSGGVALEKNGGFAGMARGKVIETKRGERESAVAKIGPSESEGQGA